VVIDAVAQRVPPAPRDDLGRGASKPALLFGDEADQEDGAPHVGPALLARRALGLENLRTTPVHHPGQRDRVEGAGVHQPVAELFGLATSRIGRAPIPRHRSPGTDAQHTDNHHQTYDRGSYTPQRLPMTVGRHGPSERRHQAAGPSGKPPKNQRPTSRAADAAWAFPAPTLAGR
jgi:hypothetical protein